MLTDEQREKRKNGLGASDTSIIMGYSTYKTPYQLYCEKTGAIDTEDEETELQYWGNALESAVVKRFSDDNNVVVTFPDTLYHPDYDYIFANLDGWIASENSVLEIKCVNSFQRKQWDLATKDGIPLNYLIQVAKQCVITNASRGHVAVLIGGMEYKEFVYERDAALEELIIQADIDFWHCVKNGIEPDPINTSDCRMKFNESNPDKFAQTTFKTANALTKLTETKQEIKRLNEIEEEYKVHLMSHMGNAEYLVGEEGEILVTWKANKKGTRVFNIK